MNMTAKSYYEIKLSRLRKRCSKCLRFRKNEALTFSWCGRCEKYTETLDEFKENHENEIRMDIPIR